MKRLIAIILTTCVVSFLIFPFAFTFFPSQNTKNIMGALGIVLYLYNTVHNRRDVTMEKGTIWVFIAALGVSLMSIVTMVIHNSADDTYVSYIMTLLIWLSAAYVCICVMKMTHGYASATLCIQYLAAVGVAQCIIALLIDNIPAFGNFVDSWMVGGNSFYKRAGRLYGIGCALDVAGVRFSCIQVMLGYYCFEASCNVDRKRLRQGLISFAIIAIVGNMIARTTIVGCALAIALWVFYTLIPRAMLNKRIAPLWRSFAFVVLAFTGVCTFLYNVDENARKNLRFGFEGFFSIAEKGHWETNSNNQLEGMVVWPDNTATWIWGDGYMLDPTDVDPYLQSLGISGDYVYMGTDIGYCRFIFYFGIVGLAVFIIYFAVVAAACGARAPSKKMAFFLMFCVNLIVWAKVTTDVFAVLVLFLLTDIEVEEDDEEEPEEIEG